MFSKQPNPIFLFLLFFAPLFFLGCPKKGDQVKKPKAKAKGQVIKQSHGCVKGRIVNENGSGFGGVQISTKPPTSLEVTSSSGFFEICYARKVINKDTGETQKITIPFGGYKLAVVKEGYHSRPISFNYKGKDLRLNSVMMVEKTKPLPEVTRTKVKNDTKRSSGSGKAPIR